MLTAEPLPEAQVKHFVEKIVSSPVEKGSGREAFVFGNGAWIDFDADRSKKWLRGIGEGVKARFPAFMDTDAGQHQMPKLFVTPNAQGFRKPAVFSQLQNNIAIMRMEHEMADWCEENGYDMLGFYNATVQAESPDGTHASMESNLLKAMMVMNWLNMLDRES